MLSLCAWCLALDQLKLTGPENGPVLSIYIHLPGQTANKSTKKKKTQPKHAWLESHEGNRSKWSNKCARRCPLRGTTHVRTMPPCCCAAWKAVGTEPLSWNTIVCFWGVCVLSVGAGLSLCAALFTCWNITLIPERTPWGPFGPKQWRQAVFNTPHSALLSFSTIYSGCWGESRNVVQLWGITHPVCCVCKQQMWQRLCLLFCQFDLYVFVWTRTTYFKCPSSNFIPLKWHTPDL